MHLVRTISVAVVALGLMAQAAQARPTGVPPQGAAAQARAASQQPVVSPHSGQLGAAVAAAGRDRTSGTARAVQTPNQFAALRLQRAKTAASSSSDVNWAALGGVAIIALVGALAAVTLRQRPQRPAAA
jgi:hypothetical protein